MNEGVADNRLTSERIKAFQDALELLYIKSNISGRLHFAHEWPAPAQLIFGEELYGMDCEGTSDRSRRSALEEKAETRRIALLHTVKTLENKSAERGVMNMDYVRDTITNYGRATSLLLYSPKIVDRFIPPPAGGDATQEKPQHTGAYIVPEPEITIEPLPEAMNVIPLDLDPEQEEAPTRQSVDPMDDIQPISVGGPAPAQQETTPPPAPPPYEPPPRVQASVDLPQPSISAPTIMPPQPRDEPEGDAPFAPNTFERVEEPEPEPAKRGKLKIFGIKDDSNEGGGNPPA